MVTTAADLNSALVQEIQQRATEQTVSDQIPNNRFQGEFDAGRLLKLEQYQLKTTKATIDAEPTDIDPLTAVRDFKAATLLEYQRKDYEIDTFIESRLQTPWTDTVFGPAGANARMVSEQARAVARERDIKIFGKLFGLATQGTSGTAGKYGTTANRIDENGNPMGTFTGDGALANFLFDIIRNLNNRAINALYGIGAVSQYPRFIVAHPYLVEAALNYWEDHKTTSFTPDINSQVILEDRFGLRGFRFYYRGCYVLESLLVPTSGKDWQVLGAVGQIGSTLINGPSFSAALNPAILQKYANETVVVQSLAVEEDLPNALYKWQVQRDA